MILSVLWAIAFVLEAYVPSIIVVVVVVVVVEVVALTVVVLVVADDHDPSTVIVAFVSALQNGSLPHSYYISAHNSSMKPFDYRIAVPGPVRKDPNLQSSGSCKPLITTWTF